MYILESLAFMQITLWTRLCLEYVCILLVLIKQTYTLKFVFNENFLWCIGILSFINYFHEYVIHLILVHSHYFLLMTLFHEHIFALYRFRVSTLVYLVCYHEIYLYFYSLLEGFRTSFQDYHKTSFVILQYGSVFQTMLKISLIHNFENPYQPKGWWLGDHALCILFNIFQTCV